MVNVLKILFLLKLCFLSAGILPENGSNFNYTQIYFKWLQIPNAEEYQLKIQNLNNSEEIILNVPHNSILIQNELDWGTSFSWSVCSKDVLGEIIECSENIFFTINPLPFYFPDEIVIHTHTESSSQNGVTVMDIESLDFSTALDMSGNPIWFTEKSGNAENFVFTQFLSNGNVVGWGDGTGYEIDLNGQIIFQTPNEISVHHKFYKSPKDTYFMISATIQNQYCPEECNPALPDIIPWQGDIFIELDANGDEIWSWNTFNYIDSTEYNPYYVQTYTGAYQMDWTHSNSVFYDENSESVFISIRNLSRITKINYLNKNIVWDLGQTDFMNNIYYDVDLNFSQQHSVQVLENGNLLFFDNHRYLNPELSRCVEVEYNENTHEATIVWEHQLPAEFSSGSRGECDRLKNGNTLITAGRTGNTLEVTPENEVVWHLEVENSGIDVTMYRSERIQNLHPIAYSITLDNYIGTLANAYVEPNNNILKSTIHNNSWVDGQFYYSLQKDNEVITSGNIIVNSFSNTELDINIEPFNINSESILTLEIYSESAPDKIESINFNIISSSLLGDLNYDGELNILDIVILSNLILLGDDSNNNGDLNNDNDQNILDIVVLINIILNEL